MRFLAIAATVVAIVVSVVAIVGGFALLARRLLGLGFGLVRLLLAGLIGFAVAGPIFQAMSGTMAAQGSSVAPLWFLILAGAAALLPHYQNPSREAFHSLTLSNFHELLRDHDIYVAILNSLKVGVGAAVASVLLSAMAAWVVIRTSIRFRSALEYVVTAPLVFPGVVLGVAMLQAFLDLPIPIYGTLWVLVIAFSVKYNPYAMRFSSPGILQIDKELEEAASMSGAGWFRTFYRVVLPLMAASVTGAFLYIFLLSMKELSVALLLYTPGTQLVSVQIYTLWTQGQITQLAAFGVFITVALILVSLVFRKLTARFGVRQL